MQYNTSINQLRCGGNDTVIEMFMMLQKFRKMYSDEWMSMLDTVNGQT